MRLGIAQAKQLGNRFRHTLLLTCIFIFGFCGVVEASGTTATAATVDGARTESALQWQGMTVRRIRFEGVTSERLAALAGHLAQTNAAPLDREKLQESLRQLYATGLYDAIEVAATPLDDGVDLLFRGTPRPFLGTVSVYGATGATMNSQLERSSQLAAGTRFTQAKLDRALDEMRQTLAANGYHEPKITPTLTPRTEDQLVDIAFLVSSGPQARVGTVDVTGDSGMSLDEFRRIAHLRAGSFVHHETSSRALSKVLKYYQKEDRLEAEIKLESQPCDAETMKCDFHFSVNRGPAVKIAVTGAAIDPMRIRHILPVFEEGTVDEDLLNEGNRRLRDYYQRQGFFDVKVEHQQQNLQADSLVILYKVELGARRRVESVSVTGNHYFDSATLADLLSVRAAGATAGILNHHGIYSQALVNADVSALETVYRNNGFANVKITPETASIPKNANGQISPGQASPLAVLYRIEEGTQLRVGAVRLEGAEDADSSKLVSLMNTTAGQLLSPENLAGDRDALATDYMSRGFDQARVEVSQSFETADASMVDVVFHITEGQQIFVRKVLLTGLRATRPSTTERAITLHPGDPLNQTALLETQRNLYDLSLFNEVDTAIENPSGGETSKTVLLQATEARRWALTYGFGFEAQTGTPQNNCAAAKAGGVACNPNGTTGVSPRVLLDITRNSLFGRDQSLSLRSTYGLLEQKVDLLFLNPHFEGNRNFGLTFSGGYANSKDVTTYVASQLAGGLRATEHFNSPNSRLSKANTLIYEYDFRRVKVDAASLQVYPAEIQQLSTAVRVGGPAFTWIRDTRDSPLDTHRGTYFSFQEFFSSQLFGGQAEFSRIDLSNSSYHTFDKGRYVLARNTRYGQERAFGNGSEELIPLPERLYAGGATSLRSFGSNSAGPRDPETGYPIGGAGALINSTELRLPPPTLPWLGDSLSFVLFHDMGNIFTNAGDAWASALRVRQPDRDACKIKSFGCNLNYFSHAPGLGLRYHTPVGPMRLDFSYNVNPPIYPVTVNYSQSDASPHMGEAPHFNFFFSLGQTF